MAVTAPAREIGMPVTSGPFKNKSFKVAAAASQKMDTSAAFACAASKDHNDRINGATIVTYCRTFCSNPFYLPVARLVNML